MARIVQGPLLQFKCHACGTLAEGEEREFLPRHTMPPTWSINCPFCRLPVVCSPTALICKVVGALRA